MKAYLLLAVIATAVTFLVTPVVRRIALARQILTPIRPRDVHSEPIARLGGIGMMIGFSITFLMACRMAYFEPFFRDPQAWALLGGGVAICGLGILDDILELNWWTKLAGQILISGIVAWYGIQIVSFPIFGLTVGSARLSIMVTVLIIVASINAVNFVDGLDGLAAGVVGIGSAAYFGYAYILIRLTSSQTYASLAAMIAIILFGVCLGFLFSNFHVAKIFMGDSGSMFLGYVVACNVIVITGQIDPAAFGQSQFLPAVIPILLPLAVMVLPLTDMTMAVIRRLRAGKSPFSADRMHLHHRLLRMGHSHRRAVLIMYFWASGFSILGVGLVVTNVRNVVIAALIWLTFATLLSFRLLPGLRKQWKGTKKSEDDQCGYQNYQSRQQDSRGKNQDELGRKQEVNRGSEAEPNRKPPLIRESTPSKLLLAQEPGRAEQKLSEGTGLTRSDECAQRGEQRR